MEEQVYFSFTGCITPPLFRRATMVTLRLVRILSTVCGIVFLLFGLLLLLGSAVSGLCAMACGVFLLFYPGIVCSLLTRRFANTKSIQLNTSYTVTFTATAMVDESAYGHMTIPYEKIIKVVDTADLILVYIAFNRYVILEKRRITAGDPAAFFEFLCSTHGVSYKKG